MQENPAGEAIWYFAFDEENRTLAGTISITPRNMILNGKHIKAGIVGDYMIGDQYRVFGPALGLQKMVIDSMSKYGFDCIYTIPNIASKKMAQRAGYVCVAELMHFVKPVLTALYIRKYLNNRASELIGLVLDFMLKLISKDTYIKLDGCYEEALTIDASFDVLWKKVKKNTTGLIGDHSAEYIDWRYLKNPNNNYHILTHRKKPEGELLGYLVFSMNNGKIEIYDIISSGISSKERLLGKIIHIARKDNCKSIYIRLSKSSQFINNISKYIFYNARNDIELYAVSDDVSCFEKWEYSEGDRNT